MKEDVVVTTITVHSTAQNVVVTSILWACYLVAFCVTAWRILQAWKQQEQSGGAEREESSSGDTSRSLFYRLLGIALLSRIIFIPIENVTDGEMFFLVAETLPQLAFSSVWALLVAFFVQLVGTASGSSSSNTPSLVIHIAVYLMYIILVVWYWWNDAAAVLIYALLCIVYASLFGTLVYFGPKLVALLQPSLERQSGLASRLIACCTIGLLVFLMQAISLACTVVTPTAEVPYWMTYGFLELLPASLLLAMMHPTRKKGGDSNGSTPSSSPPNDAEAQQQRQPGGGSNMRRISSSGSTGGAATPAAANTTGNGSATVGRAMLASSSTQKSSTGEMATLLKPQASAQQQQQYYGATTAVSKEQVLP